MINQLLFKDMPSVLVENVGLTPHDAILIAGFIELMFIFGNTVPALALDRMGRRPTMMYAALRSASHPHEDSTNFVEIIGSVAPA